MALPAARCRWLITITHHAEADSAIVLFICAGGVMIYSLMGHSDWHPTLKTDGMWFPHGWQQIVVCITIVIYSFQGVELVGNAAGETESPHVILPKVILGIGLRIMLFYGLAIAVLALVSLLTRYIPAQ